MNFSRGAAEKNTAVNDTDLQYIDEAIERLGRRTESVIPILQALQTHFRYLPREAMERVCRLTEITPATITGVSTFYTQFRHRPVGKHIISVCHGTACHVRGSELVQAALERRLGITRGNDTDSQGLFTIEKVACLGCCTLAPVIQIDQVTYGNLNSQSAGDVIDSFLNRDQEGQPASAAAAVKDASVGEIRVGLGSCCVALGSGDVYETICRTLASTGAKAVVKQVGCVGMCHQTPLVELIPAGGGPSKLFARVQAEHARAIVLSEFKPKTFWQRLTERTAGWFDRFLSDETPNPVTDRAIDAGDRPVCAFLGPQRHLSTEYCGQIDPTDLDEYYRHNGFKALHRCLEELSPEQIIEQVRASGLRGRGGAGFPTAQKWTTARAAPGEKKYVICNGDEGDPGAFMDRMLLESFPYRIIEGMAIAAKAVGADEGIFYIRAEYPLAVKRIRAALHNLQERGLLGDRVLGTEFRLHISVKEGAGAFVCGEETALLASLEGRRGMPRLRPPYPAESGLWGKPTSVNNVETYALLPWIFRNGAEAFARLGTEKSKGTKVFALAGKVVRGGLIEVPMGITVRQIVEEIGGGVAGGRKFKAVQIGGPSGGCVPADLADTTVDFEALSEVGAIMGSGGMVVLDDRDCMVDMARYFLRFTQDQSCGKCTVCRIGTRRMLDILDRICSGKGHKSDLELLEQLCHTVGAGSICGLGRTAPNPVLSTLRYFRPEFEAHVAGRCPAGKCKDLVAYRVNEACIGCTLCAQKCPVEAIPMAPYARHTIDMQKCTRCDTCRQVCPTQAVYVE
jgi:NADH-quinone oxidoreductase subunit F